MRPALKPGYHQLNPPTVRNGHHNMRKYCFAVRDALNGTKSIGGTVTAETMDEAAIKAVETCKITHTKEADGPNHIRHRHMMNGREVYVSVTAHPEYLN